jgi:hypothetical protein
LVQGSKVQGCGKKQEPIARIQEAVVRRQEKGERIKEGRTLRLKDERTG